MNTLNLPELTCDVCNINKAIGVAAVPGVPMSVAYCKDCLEKDSHPMFILIANTACCGGLNNCNNQWKEIINHSLKAQNKTIEWFNKEVEESMKDEEQE